MLQGVAESFVIAAPQAPGSGTANEVHQVNVHAASLTGIDLGLNIPATGAWFTFQSTVATRIAFADVDDVDADDNSWLLEADREYRYFCSPAQSRYFSVKRDGGSDGTLVYYCSQARLPVN